MPHPSWSTVQRVLGEATVIVVSVYVAIVLEGWSSDRAEAADAQAALLQVRAELLADHADLQDILTEQRELSLLYRRLLTWLESPTSMPNDSVDGALVRIAPATVRCFRGEGLGPACCQAVSFPRLATTGS